MNEPRPPATLQDLRRAGAARLDPVRFHWLEALSRRMAAQPEAVRRLLQERLEAGMAELAGRVERAAAAAPGPIVVKPRSAAPCAPLAQLNEHIRRAGGAGETAGPFGDPPDEHELASARRFRQAWSSTRSQQRVDQAAARRPAQAGPLNSHALVLQSLALARELSPEYLRRLLAQVESLQWLERAREQLPAAAKTATKGKAGKSATSRAKKGPR